MGTLAEDKRKALLQARPNKIKKDKDIKLNKPKEMPIETVIDMSCV